MARVCQLTGKRTTAGNNRPFSLKATKRTFRPNLFVKKMFNPETGRVEKMKLSAKAIRTLKKWAAQGAAKVDPVTAAVISTEGTGKHVKKEKMTPKQKKELEAKKAEEAKEAGESA
jgi:large subunit ribosomal protein L28